MFESMKAEQNIHSGCVADLPFENLSGDQSQDYFAEGFVEELITDFSHFANLQVISSYTSRKMGTETRDELKEARNEQISKSITAIIAANLFYRRRIGNHPRISSKP